MAYDLGTGSSVTEVPYSIANRTPLEALTWGRNRPYEEYEGRRLKRFRYELSPPWREIEYASTGDICPAWPCCEGVGGPVPPDCEPIPTLHAWLPPIDGFKACSTLCAGCSDEFISSFGMTEDLAVSPEYPERWYLKAIYEDPLEALPPMEEWIRCDPDIAEGKHIEEWCALPSWYIAGYNDIGQLIDLLLTNQLVNAHNLMFDGLYTLWGRQVGTILAEDINPGWIIYRMEEDGEPTEFKIVHYEVLGEPNPAGDPIFTSCEGGIGGEGCKGATGPQGIQGEEGPQGPPGESPDITPLIAAMTAILAAIVGEDPPEETIVTSLERMADAVEILASAEVSAEFMRENLIVSTDGTAEDADE